MRSVSILFLLSAAVVSAWGQRNGSVCIATLDKPTRVAKSLGNPTGGDTYHKYRITISGKAADASYDRGALISGLDTTKRHLVKIWRNGRMIQSFRFVFREYQTEELCIWLKDLYGTWQLWDAKDSPGCKCGK